MAWVAALNFTTLSADAFGNNRGRISVYMSGVGI
jgi:hypothetical protein